MWPINPNTSAAILGRASAVTAVADDDEAVVRRIIAGVATKACDPTMAAAAKTAEKENRFIVAVAVLLF